MAEVLDVLEEGDISFEMSNPSSPGVVKSVGKQDYTHVIMPMFVQW